MEEQAYAKRHRRIAIILIAAVVGTLVIANLLLRFYADKYAKVKKDSSQTTAQKSQTSGK